MSQQRASESSADLKSAGPPDGWPDGEAVSATLNVQQLTKATLDEVSASDMQVLLKRIPRDVARSALHVINLHSMGSINAGMAGQLLVRLRQDPASAESYALRVLLAPIVELFRRSPLSGKEWEALVGTPPEPALRTLLQHSPLIATMDDVERIPRSLRPVGLSVAIALRGSGSAAALGLLAQSRPEARSAYKALRAEHPALPGSYVADLNALLPRQRAKQVGIALPGQIDGRVLYQAMSAYAADRTDLTAPETDELSTHPTPSDEIDEDLIPADDDPLESAERISAEWATTVAAGERLLRALRAGELPDLGDVTNIEKTVRLATALLRRLAAETGREIAASLPAIEAAVTALRRGRDRGWLRDLADLRGPTDLAGELATLREAATAPPALDSDEENELRTVYEFLTLARDDAEAAHQRLWDIGNQLSPAYKKLLGAVTFRHREFTFLEQPAVVPSAATAPASEVVTAVEEIPADGTADIAPSAVDPASEQPSEQAATERDLATELDELLDSGRTGPLSRLGETTDRRTPPQTVVASPPAPRSPFPPVPEPPVRTDPPPAEEVVETAGPTELPADRAAGESSVGARVPQADDSDRAPAAPDAAVTLVSAELLRDGRLGLAACLAEASGRPPAVVAARRMAAFAPAVRSSSGPLAAALTEDAALVSRTQLAEDRASQLLAWAAALRVVTTSYLPQLGDVITDLTPCVEGHEGLVDLGRILFKATIEGLIVGPESGNDLAAGREADERARSCAEQAARLIETAPSRTNRYAPAGTVYQSWMSNGRLGTLLKLVRENNAASLDQVHQGLLDAQGAVDREINDEYARMTTRAKAKIEAGARHKLTKQYQQGLDIVAEWTDAVLQLRRLQERERDAASVRLNELRRNVDRCRQTALDDLCAVADDTRGGPELSAAVAYVRDLLAQIFSAFAGACPSGPEPSPAFVAAGELLATDLFLQPDTLLPAGGLHPDHLPEVLRVAGAPRADLNQLYERRATAGDHDLTAVLLSTGATGHPPDESLRTRRFKDVSAMAAKNVGRLQDLRGRVEQARMAGHLDESEWSRCAQRIDLLNDPERVDFRHIRAELTDIALELDRARARSIERVLGDIDREAARELPGEHRITNHLDRLRAMARQGEVAGAEEYLEQLRTGREIPAMPSREDHLTRFFRRIPDLVASQPDILDRLRLVLDRGVDPTPAVRELTRALGQDPRDLPMARRRAAVRALDAWTAMAQRRLQAQKLDTQRALGEILSHAGIDFKRAAPDEDEQKGRRWWTLHQVATHGFAANPVLGTRMSPDGATLRVLVVHAAPSVTRGDDPSVARLMEWSRQESEGNTVLVLWLSAPLNRTSRRQLAELSRGRPRPPLLLLDAAALCYLLLQPEPSRGAFIGIAAPFSAANPYRDRAGDAPEEMFFGRSRELAQVMDLGGSSIVYGGRQLGKSALLRAAQRAFTRRSASAVAVYLSIFSVGSDGHADGLWPELWRSLADQAVLPEVAPVEDLARAVHDGVRDWVRADPTRSLLILLDEADAFLEADANNHFTQVDWVRRIMLEGAPGQAKIVFAGLHRTARFTAVPNQPLAHFGTPVLIGPLHPQQAYELITQPLATLGLRFKDEQSAPARIMAHTNNIPALLQIFGRALVAHQFNRPVGPEEPPVAITDEDVDAVIHNAGLRTELIQKYNLTLDLDHRYRIIAHVLALVAYEEEDGAAGLTVDDIAEQCRIYWPSGFARCERLELESLVDECVDLGVLARDGYRYRVRTPTVLRFLGDHESVLQTLFAASERFEVPAPNNRQLFRRDLGKEGSWRSPLTERQINYLVRHRGAFVITGSPSLGRHFVTNALEVVKEKLGADEVRRVRPVLDQIRHAMGRGTRPLVVVDAGECTERRLEPILEYAAEVSDDRRLLILAGARSAPAWIRHPRRVALARLEAVGTRLWCEEGNLPFRDEGERQQLVDHTGGWPSLLVQLTDQARRNAGLSAEGLLSDFAGWWRSTGARQLLADVELVVADGGESPRDEDDARTVLREVLTVLSHLCPARATEEPLLIATLDDAAGNLAHAARRCGFSDLHDVFETLRVLGFLEVTDDQIRIEPVLLSALCGSTISTG